MHRLRATRTPLLTILVCMLLAVPALAVPDRDAEGKAPRPERPSWTRVVRDAVVSIAAKAGLIVRDEEPPTKGGRTPGPVIDPDGHKPTTE